MRDRPDLRYRGYLLMPEKAFPREKNATLGAQADSFSAASVAFLERCLGVARRGVRKVCRIRDVQFFVGVLKLIEPPVEPTEPQKFVMGPAFPQVAMVQHHYPVASLDGRKPMGNHE